MTFSVLYFVITGIFSGYPLIGSAEIVWVTEAEAVRNLGNIHFFTSHKLLSFSDLDSGNVLMNGASQHFLEQAEEMRQ